MPPAPPADRPPDRLREDAVAIWTAGVDAVRPGKRVVDAVAGFPAEWRQALADAPRVLVVGAGKAGARMAAGLEAALPGAVGRMAGLVNVPEGEPDPTHRLWLHPARPAGSNHPTAAGVAGTDEMLRLLATAGPDDVAVCLLSGGGSALLPAPADGVTLEDKQHVTRLLHASGATIGEMNAVRKHLSRVKGGQLAAAFRGKLFVSLIISDVVGDPLDVIASGPTAPDPTTFADAVAVISRYGLGQAVPPAVLRHLVRGIGGEVPETLKALPSTVHNLVIGSNADALSAAAARAADLGYAVLNLGPFIEGETREVGTAVAGLVRGIRANGTPLAPPACILLGGETTVTLGPTPGRGGRNQEFALAVAHKLGPALDGVAVLSGGTDGEDGPTDAAGAVATSVVMAAATAAGLDPAAALARHDSYPFFDRAGGLLKTGLTGTNVMDLRVILLDR